VDLILDEAIGRGRPVLLALVLQVEHHVVEGGAAQPQGDLAQRGSILHIADAVHRLGGPRHVDEEAVGAGAAEDVDQPLPLRLGEGATGPHHRVGRVGAARRARGLRPPVGQDADAVDVHRVAQRPEVGLELAVGDVERVEVGDEGQEAGLTVDGEAVSLDGERLGRGGGRGERQRGGGEQRGEGECWWSLHEGSFFCSSSQLGARLPTTASAKDRTLPASEARGVRKVARLAGARDLRHLAWPRARQRCDVPRGSAVRREVARSRSSVLGNDDDGHGTGINCESADDRVNW
jgi:hypothetical protein